MWSYSHLGYCFKNVDPYNLDPGEVYPKGIRKIGQFPAYKVIRHKTYSVGASKMPTKGLRNIRKIMENPV